MQGIRRYPLNHCSFQEENKPRVVYWGGGVEKILVEWGRRSIVTTRSFLERNNLVNKPCRNPANYFSIIRCRVINSQQELYAELLSANDLRRISIVVFTRLFLSENGRVVTIGEEVVLHVSSVLATLYGIVNTGNVNADFKLPTHKRYSVLMDILSAKFTHLH